MIVGMDVINVNCIIFFSNSSSKIKKGTVNDENDTVILIIHTIIYVPFNVLMEYIILICHKLLIHNCLLNI